MDLGLTYALLTAVIWTGVACGYVAAARRGMTMAPFVATAASTAALLSLGFTVRWSELPAWREAVPVAVMIAMSGISGQSCMLLNGAAMKAAPARSASTWTINQMAMVLPFLVATVSGREHAAWYKWAALPFILIAFLGLTPESGERARTAEHRRAWLILLLAAFICAGLSQSLAQEVSLRGWRDTLNLRVPVSLGAAGVFLWVVALLRKEYPTPRHLAIGGLTGILVASGNMTVFAALDLCAAHGKAYLVFPIAGGGSVLLFAAYQMLRRHEAFEAKKALGIACGMAGIALLSVP